jgi:hypothetical protein
MCRVTPLLLSVPAPTDNPVALKASAARPSQTDAVIPGRSLRAKVTDELKAEPRNLVSYSNVPKSVPKRHENGPRSLLRGPFCLVAGTGFEPATSGL